MGSCASCSPTKALDVPGWRRRDSRTRLHLRAPARTAHPGGAFSKGQHDGTNSAWWPPTNPSAATRRGLTVDTKASGMAGVTNNTGAGKPAVTQAPGAAGAARRALVALTLLFLPERMHSSILCGGAGQWICRKTGDGEEMGNTGLLSPSLSPSPAPAPPGGTLGTPSPTSPPGPQPEGRQLTMRGSRLMSCRSRERT